MNAPADLQIPTALALSALRESPTNPRKHFDEAALNELAASLREHGVMSPLLVRPWPGEGKAYEIVAGARRYRAAKIAQLQGVPAIIRDLTDKQVVELQLIENLQRKDLHELEEAEGFKLLVDRHGYSVDDIAAKIGKSVRHVYTRLQLCRIAGAAREAFSEGKLSASVALLLARIPVKALQEKAAKEVTTPDYAGEPMSFRQARDYIERNFMLALKGAPFPTEDAALVPKAGACGACPKRTGNQAELFGDVKSADTCTDPTCFSAKKEAHRERRAAEWKAQGVKVITGKAAKEIKPHAWSDSLAQGYVALDDRCDDDPSGKRRTWRDLIKDSTDGLTGLAVLEVPGSDDMTEIAPRTALKKLAEIRGVDWSKKPPAPTSGQSRTPKLTPQQEKRAKEEAAERKLRARIVQTIVAKVPIAPTMKDLRLLAWDALDTFGTMSDADESAEIIKRYGLTNFRSAPAGALAKVKDGDVLRMLVDMMLTTRIGGPAYHDGKTDLIMETAARYKVDVAKVKATIAAEEKAAAAAAAAPEKKPAKAPAKKATKAKAAKK